MGHCCRVGNSRNGKESSDTRIRPCSSKCRTFLLVEEFFNLFNLKLPRILQFFLRPSIAPYMEAESDFLSCIEREINELLPVRKISKQVQMVWDDRISWQSFTRERTKSTTICVLYCILGHTFHFSHEKRAQCSRLSANVLWNRNIAI